MRRPLPRARLAALVSLSFACAAYAVPAGAAPGVPSAGVPSAGGSDPAAATTASTRSHHGLGPLARAARDARARTAHPGTARRAAAPAAITQAAGTFVPVPSARLLDTRSDLGGSTPGAGGIVHVPVLGHGGVPLTGVAAVVLTVTAVAPAAGGYVTAYADGAARPHTSNLNFVAGRTVPNLVVVPVGADGKVALYNGSSAATALLADVSGYYVSGTPSVPGSFTSLAPARVLDTRAHLGASTPAGHGTVQLQVTGHGGVPTTGAAAVVLNVTAVSPSAGGYVTAYAGGAARPASSNLNSVAHRTVPNLVVAPVGADGKVALYNGSSAPTPLLADVAGWFRAGTVSAPGAFKVLPPARAMDTRQLIGAGRLGPHTAIALGVDGEDSDVPTGVPSTNVLAVALNVTVTGPSAAGYVSVFDDEDAADGPPATSNLNFVAGQTVADLTFAPVSRDSYTDFYNGSAGSTDLLADVAGYYLAGNGLVSGTVTAAADATPVPNVGVELDESGDESGGDGSGTFTDDGGKYVVPDLRPAAYDQCFYPTSGDPADGGSGGPATGYAPLCRQTTIPVNGHVVVNAALQPGGAISGTVTGSDTNRAGLHNVEVDVSGGDPQSVADATTDAAGHFTVDSLAPGDYQVCFYGGDAVNGSPGGYLVDCLADTVSVQAGSTTPGANTVLSPGAALSGTVTLAGSAAGDYRDFGPVTVFDSGGGYVGSSYPSASDGTYRVGGLPDGAATVCFVESYDETTRTDYADQCYNAKAWDGDPTRLPTGTTAVTVAVDTVHTGINATLAPVH